MTSFLDISDFW